MSPPTATPGVLPAPASVREHTTRITEAVVAAWHGAHGGSRVEIPISVVAALSLLPERHPGGVDLAPLLLRLTPDRFIELLHRIQLEFGVLRPDLRPRTKPLWDWLNDEPDEHLVRAVHATGCAALRNGQLALTGDEHRSMDSDLLGAVLQTIRSRKDLEARGQFLTPLAVTDMIGEINAANVMGELGAKDGSISIMDPCVGTGAMLLGAANALRRQGRDPAAMEWWANDIDWVAAACCAVNVHRWELGLRVVVGCGDGLLNNWMREALTERQAAIDELAGLWKTGRSFAALRFVLGLGPQEDPFLAHLRSLVPRPPKAPPPHSSTFDPESACRQATLF